MRNFRFTITLALALALRAALLAQGGVTGVVSGTVRSHGQPVSGVTVRLTSPALQGERVVTTGSNGDYVALGLPPDEYVIQFSKPGMRTATHTATADLSGTTRMDADLDVVAIEALTIRGDLPTPIATAQLGANYKAADLDKLPVGRTLAAIAVQTPGVVVSGLREGGIRINGAFGFDNVFLVDGTDINDNLHGTANNLYIEEAVSDPPGDQAFRRHPLLENRSTEIVENQSSSLRYLCPACDRPDSLALPHRREARRRRDGCRLSGG